MNTDFDRLLIAAMQNHPQQVRNKITLAAFLDESPQSIGNWVKRGVPKDKLTSIARKVGVTAEWIETGVNPTVLGSDNGQEATFPRTPREEDYFLIPIYSTYGACGNGFLNDHIEVIGDKAFAKEHIKKLNIDPYSACIIHAAGDSMYPYIADGDEVLIDKRIAPTRTGEIYAVMIDGEVFIKRLAREFGTIVLRGDNPNKSLYPDMRVPSGVDLTIIGRVVWRGGST